MPAGERKPGLTIVRHEIMDPDRYGCQLTQIFPDSGYPSDRECV
jgi:hypothetical protein